MSEPTTFRDFAGAIMGGDTARAADCFGLAEGDVASAVTTLRKRYPR